MRLDSDRQGQHSSFQKLEASTPVHLTLDNFESVDLALDRSVVPERFDRQVHRAQLDTASLTQFADFLAESSLGIASHAGNLVPLTLIRRQTISSISRTAIGRQFDNIPQKSEDRWTQQCLKSD
jgi:hypothetical protein